ncbi:MAG: IS110 family transposase [Hyphomicrobiaceae bacterium]|nr:IS110 family transposase [Hyphomicrobiaceae bacterium]
MNFIGADLHKKSITFCVLSVERGGRPQLVTTRRLPCDATGTIEDFLVAHGPAELVVEATIGFDWFASLAEGVCRRVVLAHAGKMRIIAESTRKSDKVDARVLAEFLARDMIPEAWRPTPRIRQHRSLIRYRQRLVRRQTSVKNTIRGILTRYNADRSDLFTRRGWAAALSTDLHAAEKWLLEQHKRDLERIRDQLKAVDAKLAEFASQAAVAEREARAVLATMPGVGPVTIDVILAELGDWRRFKNCNAVVAFAGLAPGVRSSDETRHSLRMTKAGSPLLRFAMVQLAHRLKRSTARWQRSFSQLENRIGSKKATCAIARRLLITLYAMLRDGRAYQMAAAA